MSIFTSPWCFATFKKASRAAAIYCLVLHIVDIILLIYSAVAIHFLKEQSTPAYRRNYIAPGLDVISYICLISSLLVVIISAIKLTWIKQGYPRTPHLMLWVCSVGGLRLLEAVFGIYILGYLGLATLQILANTSPGLIFGALYWCGSTGGMVIFGLFTFNYIRELKTTAYGGQRRHKPYMIHSNDIYSPTTRAILSAQDDDGSSAPPPLDVNPLKGKKNRVYYQKNDKRPSQTLEFESIV